MSRLPRYTLFTDKTLRERDVHPKRFAEDVAETERANSEWDTDGGYAKLIQECRVAAAGDENRAEEILFERVAHMAATRSIKEGEEEEEEQRRAAAERQRMKQAAEEDENGRRKKKKRNRGPPALLKNGKVDFPAIGLDPPPRGFGEWIKQRRPGVGDVKLVIMKGLFETDISGPHNRISIPAKQIIDVDFLTAEEVAFLHKKREADPPPGIPVRLYGPGEGGSYTEMVLKKWELNKSDSYVLNKGWMSLVRRFQDVFQKMAIIQLWSFRTAAGELSFWITKIGQLPNGENQASGSGSGSSVKSGSSLGGGSNEGSRGNCGGWSSGDDGGEIPTGFSDRDGGGSDLEEGEVTPARRGQRVWRGSCPPRQ